MPIEHRLELRDELARLYGVTADDVLAWYRARNGSGNSDYATPPSQPRRRVVRQITR